MSKIEDLRKKDDKDLMEEVETARETLRSERFKDRFARKAGVVKKAKLTIARALTVLNDRRRNSNSK
jgi:ribosomal protein L29